MVDHLLALFPRLRAGTFAVTSPRDTLYNCTAWAAGDTARWWWPLGQQPETFWPADAPRAVTLAAFQHVFVSLGYFACPSDAPEAGHEKVALFADARGVPTHAARQLASGRWTSKLGRGEDVEHNLRDLKGELYGTVVLVMRRATPAAASQVSTPSAPAAKPGG